jgi:hypothetical protein
MVTRRHLLLGSAAASLFSAFAVTSSSAQTPAARVTILFDAFGKPSNLKRGWGYSALIEYGGRRILFDTGGKGADFAYNANALGMISRISTLLSLPTAITITRPDLIMFCARIPASPSTRPWRALASTHRCPQER